MNGESANGGTGKVGEPPAIAYRPATEADLPACEQTWRDGLNDYLVPLGQYEVPPENPALRMLLAHTLETDPSRFWVATRAEAGESEERVAEAGGAEAGEAQAPGRVIGFGSAVLRDEVWFLSMLFVRPGEQAYGTGRELLQRVLPAGGDGGAAALATVTDTAQPISNGLYASVGIVPRIPMFNFVGRPSRPEALAPLPPEIHATRVEPAGETGGGAADDVGAEALAAEIAALDRETLGCAHPEDHAFMRRQGRVLFTFRNASGVLAAYGYASEMGRLGPIAVRDGSLHAPVVAHLLEAMVPRGASAIWVPGSAGPTTEMLVRAGLRIDGFPVLVCWTAPFADFARYLPISPGLL
ncbi:MAG: GNAT family N-acetyltransferase [Candidatus Limnocylindrales bacterium]